MVRTSSQANITGKSKAKDHHFAFDRVFGPASSQEGVFEEISQLVQSALDGYNICIFAYGQTGSGKTFTMEGGEEPEARGMIPRAVQQIFATAAEMEGKGWQYTFEASFLEIYQETIRDLLAPDAAQAEQKLEVKMVKGSPDVEVPGLTIEKVATEAEVHSVLQRAVATRATAKTEMNERSSRSHSVFQLRITGANATSGDSCAATLNLIDLAGSERVASSKAEGARLDEAKAINKSLSSLGNVIMALGNGVRGARLACGRSTATGQRQRQARATAVAALTLSFFISLAIRMPTSLTATASSRTFCRTSWAATTRGAAGRCSVRLRLVREHCSSVSPVPFSAPA